MTTTRPRDAITRATRENTSALAAYVEEKGHFPHITNRGESGLLARWIRDEREAHAAGSLGPKRVHLYDQTLPGWSLGQIRGGSRYAVNFHRRAAECGEYFVEHGRYPAKTAKDLSTRSLGAFLHQHRLVSRGTGCMSVRSDGERVALLDRLAPGWDTTKSETWVVRAQELITFAYENNRYPGFNEAEERLGHWFQHFRAAVTGDRRGGAPWQVTFMDRYLPGWESRTVPEEGSTPDPSLRELWRAPRVGDVVAVDSCRALAIRPQLNPTAPVIARLPGKTIELDSVPHEILQARTVRSIDLAWDARRAEDASESEPFAAVDVYLS